MINDKEIILKLNKVSKHYLVGKDKEIKAVNDVSLDLYRGECLAIVGESGCGKSTVAKLITCIEKVTVGEIYFQGKNITEYKPKQLRKLRRKMQIVFQNPFEVFSPRMKIGTFLKEPLINYYKMNNSIALEEAKKMLNCVELDSSFLEKYPHQLSGGELQRVVIARAMALNPTLIVCDEVTSALDVSIQQQIMGLLSKLHNETGMANMFISHDLALVQSFCDRVIVMYLGSIVEIMKSNELGSNAQHPYTKELLKSVFLVHRERKKFINVLPGEPPSPLDLPKGCPFSTRCSMVSDICYEQPAQLKEIELGHYVACHVMMRN